MCRRWKWRRPPVTVAADRRRDFISIKPKAAYPKPFVPCESNMLGLLESCIDPLGSLVISAPIYFPAIKSAINGEDSTNIPILPSGFIISGDGRPEKLESGASTSTRSNGTGGSLLTVAFQILVCTLSHSKQLNMESVATVNTLVCSTVQKIKAALDCSNVD